MGTKRGPDCRALVPRTPPAELWAWARKELSEDLNRHGLLYQAEWVQDWGLEQLLDEGAKPRKVKMVRVACSCCGESQLLHWGRTEKGYGFVLPEDVEGDWEHTVVSSGDECRCPICGASVLVRKRAEVKDYFVTAEAVCMSAALVGEDNRLALTGWHIQRRAYKSGGERLEVLPVEAYVFGPHECAKLMGWRKGYSGHGGYFVQYSRQWRQTGNWTERWGREEHIFGLTPELLARSALPHCKLDVYMTARPGARHYPVAYLRLYQAHPNVESLLLHGLPRVLDGLIANGVNDRLWDENRRGLLEMPAIDWTQSRPAQMLHLTKTELVMARRQCWGLFLWELFTAAKQIGEQLTEDEVQDAFCLGDEHLALLALWGQVGKSIRYLLRQCETLAQETDDAGADPIPDTQILADYWTMAQQLGRDLSDPAVRYPADLIAAHDRAAAGLKERGEADRANLFRLRRKVLKKYTFVSDGLLIRPAASQRELTAEGDALHHCVGSYGERHAQGATAIFFIRRTRQPGTPYFTLELDEGALTVRQNRGKYNGPRTPEVEVFEQKWLAWVRAGAPRDKHGRPVVRALKHGKEYVA